MDITEFAARLETRKQDLESRLRAIETELEAPASADVSEYAIEIESEEVLQGVGQAQLTELRAINAALDRVEAGTYGLCAKCGAPISEARLNAVPQAALCEDCIQ